MACKHYARREWRGQISFPCRTDQFQVNLMSNELLSARRQLADSNAELLESRRQLDREREAQASVHQLLSQLDPERRGLQPDKAETPLSCKPLSLQGIQAPMANIRRQEEAQVAANEQ